MVRLFSSWNKNSQGPLILFILFQLYLPLSHLQYHHLTTTTVATYHVPSTALRTIASNLIFTTHSQAQWWWGWGNWGLEKLRKIWEAEPQFRATEASEPGLSPTTSLPFFPMSRLPRVGRTLCVRVIHSAPNTLSSPLPANFKLIPVRFCPDSTFPCQRGCGRFPKLLC